MIENECTDVLAHHTHTCSVKKIHLQKYSVMRLCNKRYCDLCTYTLFAMLSLVPGAFDSADGVLLAVVDALGGVLVGALSMEEDRVVGGFVVRGTVVESCVPVSSVVEGIGGNSYTVEFGTITGG